jgi:hypothetical protein
MRSRLKFIISLIGLYLVLCLTTALLAKRALHNEQLEQAEKSNREIVSSMRAHPESILGYRVGDPIEGHYDAWVDGAFPPAPFFVKTRCHRVYGTNGYTFVDGWFFYTPWKVYHLSVRTISFG